MRPKPNHMIARIVFIALTLCYALTAQAQGQLKVTKPDLAKLPKGIKYSGKIKDAIQFTDREGDHLVITTETGIYYNKKFKREIEGRGAELFAYHYIMKHNTPQQTWKVYDLVQDCDVDIDAFFVKNTLQVTDLNNDGIGEIWLMYKTVCAGDVSPRDMKLIMYQGKQKFAMRGREKVLGVNGYVGGEFTFDKAFTSGPKEFRDFAEQLWNKHVMQTYGDETN